MRSMKSVSGLAALTLGIATVGFNAFADDTIDGSVASTLAQCQKISSSCANNSKSAVGVLVFPNVVKADLLIGGAGGKGALIEHGKITGYYNIGALSAGLQAGVENSSQVYLFRTTESLASLKKGSDWKVGSSADVAVVTADAGVRGNTDANVWAYVFDAKGLHAGASVDVYDVWKSGSSRPNA